MTPTAGLLQLSLLALVVLTLLASAASGALYVPLRSRLARWAPAARAKALLVWIMTPALVGVVLTGLCFVPSLLALLAGGAGDHCLAHPDHHVHLCLLHPPRHAGSPLGWALLAATAAVLAVVGGRHAAALSRARRALRRLLSSADLDRTRAVAWVRSSTPLAITVGIVRPRVVITDALRRRLPRPLLRAVLAHEVAHQRRGDVLRKALASLFALLHWPTVRRHLLDDLSLACEQAADAEAAAKLHDPIRVADAILAVERLTESCTHGALATAASFGGPSLTARVEQLLRPSAGVRSLRLRRWVAMTAGAALFLAEPLHHVVETLLTPLAR